MTRAIVRSTSPARRAAAAPRTPLAPAALATALLATALLAAACADPVSRSTPSAPPAPIAPATAPSAAARDGDAGRQLPRPLRNYELTVERLDGLYRAHHELYRLAQSNPEPLERLQDAINEIPDEGFEDVALAVARSPQVLAAIVRARVTPRDFFLTQINLLDAVAVLEARAKGRVRDVPDVTDRNVEFVRTHPVEVKRVLTGRRPPAR